MTDKNNDAPTDAEMREKVWDMIKDIKVCLMVTHGAAGDHLRARPMVPVRRPEDGELWFFTKAGSDKVQEVTAKHSVLLSYAEPSDQNYVSINGTAEVIDDRAKIKELWAEPMRTWFPKGAEDPSLVLICVTPEAAEYWDAPSAAFVYAYGYLKARLTGEMPNPGENETVQM